MTDTADREPRTLASERGGALVEYGFLVSLIAMVCLVAIGFVGQSTNSQYDSSESSIAAIDTP